MFELDNTFVTMGQTEINGMDIFTVHIRLVIVPVVTSALTPLMLSPRVIIPALSLISVVTF